MLLKSTTNHSIAVTEGLLVRPLEEAREVWERAIATLPGATLYHRPRWLSLLQRTYGMTPWLATQEKDGELVAACVMAQARKPFGKGRFVSLPFSDSCPPLARDSDCAKQLLRALAHSKTIAGGCEVRGIEAPSPWQTANNLVGWTLDLKRSADEIRRSYGRDFRRKLRRAREAGVTIESGSDPSMVRRFHALQVETRLRLGLPAQPLRFFMNVQTIYAGEGDLEIWIAVHRGRDLAATFLLRDNDCVHFKWGARRLEEPSSANHLLVDTTIEHFAGRASFADLGRSDSRNQGLNLFKKECGAIPSALPYSFFPLAPLSVGSEVLSGPRKAISSLWRHLPVAVARPLGAALYGYLA